MKTHEIRDRYTQFFTDRGHTSVPSASLVVDDPNLLFVNAGMVPFKPYFLGQETPPFKTATSIQKCVRTLDIEEVGITTRHNTFFQMAGNFSFGQYFKEGAITNAWQLLTNSLEDGGFALDPELLWVTVYENDDEAEKIWHEKMGVPLERIQRMGMEDNFWSMGVPGPCGPSSEIYYDRGPAYGKDGGPAVDDTRFVEIWNLVFMQDERGEGTGKDDFSILGPLPQKNIDTGLGIERMAFLLQGVDNVYETDLLRPVIDVAEELTGVTYGAGGNSADDVRFRIIADHTRTTLMLINDGVTPSNEGRGYILRRLIRRTIRSARLMGAQGPVIERFLDTSREAMTPSYPEISDNWERIKEVGIAEEKAFSKTLEAGTKHFEQIAQEVRAQGQSVISGETAFQLHDTYGFPIDLTLEMADEAGMSVDQEVFEEAMQQQRDRAKADSKAKKNTHADLSIYRPFVDNHPTVFTGYQDLEDEGTILGIIAQGQLVDAVAGGEVQIILDKTPFYAESGGQMADHGKITTSSGVVRINDVQKVGKKVWVHSGELEGEIGVTQKANSSVDPQWRHAARQAHTGTHLIHAALREVVGPNAVQAGSLNRPGYLRFDFKSTEGLTLAQLQDIENIANEAVDNDYTVNTVETSLTEAKAMGAMALFSENYGNQVRVVEIGGPFSIELCGGIHVSHSSQVGPISIIGESSVGSGARRIEAYTGLDSFKHLAQERDVTSVLSASLKATPEELPSRVESLQQKLKEAEKQIQQLHAQQLRANVDQYLNSAQDINGIRFASAKLPDGTESNDIRSLVQDVINRLSSTPAVVLFFASTGEKVPFVVASTAEAQDMGACAGDIVKLFGAQIGGSGGGKPGLAQGSGSDISGADAGLAAVRNSL